MRCLSFQPGLSNSPSSFRADLILVTSHNRLEAELETVKAERADLQARINTVAAGGEHADELGTRVGLPDGASSRFLDQVRLNALAGTIIR